jgi:FkbM family methyltransferase
MKQDVLEGLRFQGYGPLTLLDIGAHVGTFTRGFLQAFPDCVPTLIEPNPFCQEDLAKLPFERHAVAASVENGKAELFLTKEWLQSTGSSLYRENTAFFRDEVVVRHEVDKVRLDDLFAGRRFDFVKIDTQGSELDVLRGGRAVLRQADYILVEVSLVEYNLGAAKAEAVFAELDGLGFRCAAVTDFHRLSSVNDGGLLQMDFLFERQVKRPGQTCRLTALNDHGPVLAWLQAQQARCPDFSVIDIGGGAKAWAGGVVSASVGARAREASELDFAGDLSDRRTWDPLLRHVARHGRFSYAVCSHALANLAYPALALEMLPRIAEAGYIATPSRYLESLRPEGPYRGFIHHRWMLDVIDQELVLAPKLPLVEHLAMGAEAEWPTRPDRFELQACWRGAISFNSLNDDYLGPTRDAVIGLYGQFLDRA